MIAIHCGPKPAPSIRDVAQPCESLSTFVQLLWLVMCFYNQIVWTCGFWKWSAFQYQCHKEYRIGETCGLKLVCDVDYRDQPCKLCQHLAIKQRKAAKMQADIARWLCEGNRPATVQVTEGELSTVRKEILSLTKIHDQTRSQTLPPIRDLRSPIGASWFELGFGNTVC